jgi:hypothetical protein
MTDAIAGLRRPLADAPEDRRDSRRRTVILQARLYQRGALYDCIVNNLSSSGAGVMVEVQILKNEMIVETGTVVTLTIDRFGDFPGTIVWHEAQYAGIRFLQPEADIRALFEAMLPE